MPAPFEKAIVDGVSVVRKGMHCGIQPRLLPEDQLAFAVNVTNRNGLPRTRPAWRKVALNYVDETTQTNATKGLFQCGDYYHAFGHGEDCLVALIGGRLFRYLVASSNIVQDISASKSTSLAAVFTIPAVGATAAMTVTGTGGMSAGMTIVLAGASYLIVSIAGNVVTVRNLSGVPGTVIGLGPPVPAVTFYDLNSPVNPDAWMWQAEDFLIVNNGQSYPLFFDGVSTRRSGGPAKNELPAGCMGSYVQGRVWQALPNRQGFMAGDLVYSHGFNDGYNGRSAVLKTEENTLLSGGGAFSVPITAGKINAMGSVAIADTSLGQGPLQVGTSNAIYSVQVPLDRTLWASTTYPLMTIGLQDYGPLSAWAFQTVNGDLWYRATDGERSYQIGRRDKNTWVNTPLSVEMDKVFSRDPQTMLGKVSEVLFDNRLLITCAPYAAQERGTAFQGVVALDFNNISNLTMRSDPCYDGLWTGPIILKMVKGVFNGVERCFAWGLDCSCNICLWELMHDGERYHDWDGNKDVGIQAWLETRALTYGDNGNVMKELAVADLYLDRLGGAGTGSMAWDFKFRSDEDPVWVDWHSFVLCAPLRDCATDGCPTFQNVREQYRTYLRLPNPTDDCSAITKRRKRTGYEFQVRMAWSGFAQLNRLHVWARPMKDSVVTACIGAEDCTLLTGCDEDWYAYSIENCAGRVQPPDVSPDPPPATGACCIGAGCAIMTQAECTAAGGTYQGDGTTCDTCGGSPPPSPTGACCVGGVCTVTTAAACAAAGGTYLGDGTTCDGSPCAVDPPDGGIPYLEDVPVEYPNVCISNYGMYRVTEDIVADGMTYAKSVFWRQLILNECGLTLPPNGSPSYTFAWDFVDTSDNYIGDFNAKYATGNATPGSPDEPPMMPVGSYWRLIIAWN